MNTPKQWMCIPKILDFPSLNFVRLLKALFKHEHGLGYIYIYIFLGYLYLHWAILHNALIVQQFLVVFLIVSGFMNGDVGVTLGEFPRSGNVKNTKVKQGW